MTRDEILRIISEARKTGGRIDLHGVDLHGVDLTDVNLYEANLTDVNLYEANLTGANLAEANLFRANLRRADLTGANLHGANLHGANLRGADLRGANLHWANLYAADLYATIWRGLRIDGLPSGQVTLMPTPSGWRLSVGCWQDNTVQDLRELIAGNVWPGAEGDEQERRRPALAAVADLCDAYIAANPGIVPELAEKWGTS